MYLLPLHEHHSTDARRNEMNMNFETMGKTELRAACKEAGISYGKMTVADMRAALAKAYAEGEAMEAMEQERDEAQNPEPEIKGWRNKRTIGGAEPVATAAAEKRDSARAAKLAAQQERKEAREAVARVKAAEKAEKPVREVRNGVKKPGPGLCRDVWDYLDKTGNAMPADLKDVAAQKGWNFGNVTIELYQWRKWNNLGRPEKKAAAK